MHLFSRPSSDLFSGLFECAISFECAIGPRECVIGPIFPPQDWGGFGWG